MDFSGYILEIIQNRKEGWDDKKYPFNLDAVRSWERLKLHPNVTFFVGENGSGKSTLIEAIAVAAGLNAEGGSRDHRFSTEDTHSHLSNYLRLARRAIRPKDSYFLRSETLYTQSTYLDQNTTLSRYGNHPIHQQSHGEGLMSIVWNRFEGQGLYIMDEPEAALSVERQLAFLSHIHSLVEQDSQFIIATHSPILMAYPNALIYEMSEDGPQRINWEDISHVKLTKQFLQAPERFLRTLMDTSE